MKKHTFDSAGMSHHCFSCGIHWKIVKLWAFYQICKRHKIPWFTDEVLYCSANVLCKLIVNIDWFYKCSFVSIIVKLLAEKTLHRRLLGSPVQLPGRWDILVPPTASILTVHFPSEPWLVAAPLVFFLYLFRKRTFGISGTGFFMVSALSVTRPTVSKQWRTQMYFDSLLYLDTN